MEEGPWFESRLVQRIFSLKKKKKTTDNSLIRSFDFIVELVIEPVLEAVSGHRPNVLNTLNSNLQQVVGTIGNTHLMGHATN